MAGLGVAALMAVQVWPAAAASPTKRLYVPVLGGPKHAATATPTIAPPATATATTLAPSATPTATLPPPSPTATRTPTTALSPTATSVPVATSTPVPSATATQPARTLLFADEFDGASLDGNKWSTCYWWSAPDNGCTIGSNAELEWYQPSGALVSDGTLKLRAERRTVVAQPSGKTYDYTSGMVTTGGIEHVRAPQFAFTYGYAEARVKVPAGRGLWPAFWLLPKDGLPNSSPDSRPEIDVVEIIGDKPAEANFNFHYRTASGATGDRGSEWVGPDFSAGWHTFAIDWHPGAIVWYVDGVERWRFADAANVPAEPMYLLLNLAVGGTWPGSPDASTAFPADYQVDYVRVWDSAG